MPVARLPVAAPDLSGNEGAYVADAIASSWISSTGPYVDRFERAFPAFADVRAAIPVANGTVALHLAMLALDVGPGDEVIVPALTYIATANAVRYVEAEPVFVDVNPETWTIDPQAIEEAISPRTKAIVAVHIYGHPADMDAINAIAERHGIAVIEDAAEAHGARYKGRLAGGLGRIGTFSFYGNKIITSGEGGAVTVNDEAIEHRIRLLRGQGVDPQRRYFFPVVGYNYRLTNVACAILCAQLERWDEITMARARVFEAYTTGLDGIPGIGLQPTAPWAQPAHWLYSIVVDPAQFGLNRDQLAEHLDRDGLETRPFFHPLHRLPPYADRPGAARRLPVTDALAMAGMNLPTANRMSTSDIQRVVDSIRAAKR